MDKKIKEVEHWEEKYNDTKNILQNSENKKNEMEMVFNYFVVPICLSNKGLKCLFGLFYSFLLYC